MKEIIRNAFKILSRNKRHRPSGTPKPIYSKIFKCVV